MTDKITLSNVSTFTNDSTAVTTVNNNNATIVAAFDNTLSLNGVSPNQMQANLDMNSNHILNLPAPITSTEPLRLTDANTLNGGGTITVSSLPTGGTTGQALTKNSSSNYDVGWSTFSGLPTGGTAGQYLIKHSSTNYDALWQTVVTTSNTVTGTSTTYTSTQSQQVTLRSNAGAAMIDTLPGTSPGVLPAGTYLTIVNADTSAIIAVSAGAGPTFFANKALNGWVYIGPGQSLEVFSDGTNYYAITEISLIQLTAATTFYCSPTGSSTNHGLTSSSPLDSITNCYNLVRDMVDSNNFTVTIQSANGSYSTAQIVDGRIVGQTNTDTQKSNFPVIIQGNTATPSSCTITATGDIYGALQVRGDASVLVQGFQLSTSGAGSCLYVNRAWCAYKLCNFSAANINHVAGTHMAHIEVAGNYTINGSSQSHWLVSDGASIFCENAATITLTGTPNFASAFAAAQYPTSIVMDYIPTFSGSATGARYLAFLNGIINTGGQGANFFPGNSAGSTSTGGQYN